MAQYATSCVYNGDYGIWQFSSKGVIKGINGKCDMNLSYKNYPEIIEKLGEI